MIPWLMFLMVLIQQPDSVPSAPQKTDTLRTDTLRQVIVRGDTLSPINSAIAKTLKAHPIPKPSPSLSDLLRKISPRLEDQITHPFAIKERRREKERKKHQKILQHYDQVKTFDELLREAYWQLQLEDSLEKAREK